MQSNVRLLRKERHISQTELGHVLGVSQQMVSRIEKDRERIQIRQLIMLSEYFGVTTDYILNYYIEPTEQAEKKTAGKVSADLSAEEGSDNDESEDEEAETWNEPLKVPRDPFEDHMDQLRDSLEDQFKDTFFNSDDRMLFYLFMCMHSYMQQRAM